MKFSSRWNKVTLVVLVSLTAENLFAAGVTIITHGSSGTTHDHPAWVDDMAAAIVKRAGSGTVYNFDVGILPNGSLGAYFNYESGPALSSGSTNAEVVIKLFWYKVAGVEDTFTTTDIASVVTPFLGQFNLGPTNGGPVIQRPLVELPIHLIGHSRGASVMAEISRMLAQHGVWVDQLTVLDPHPQTPADCVLLLCPGAYDAPVTVYDNVLFADNYFQIDSSGFFLISGEHINGTAEESLTPQFDIDGINDVGNFLDHIEVHDWYYGTIALTATNASGDPLPRSVWYPYFSPFTYERGYHLSRIAGGQALRENTGLQVGFSGDGWKFDGSAVRSSSYIVSWAQMPNVFLDNTSGVWTVQAGQPVTLQVRYRDAFSSNYVTMDLGVDDDQNPYNNSAASIFLTTTNDSTGNIDWQGTRQWTPRVQNDGRYVYAKVTDLNGLVRYYYLPSAFHVIPAGAPTVQAGQATAVTSSSATLNASITSVGTGSIVDARFEWTSGGFPGTIIDNIPVSGGLFSYTLAGLQPNTVYTYRAYAQNSAGLWNATVNNVTFTTGAVVQGPVIAVSGNLDFGGVTVGSSGQRTLTIRNVGTAAMIVNGITYQGSYFVGTWTGIISPGQSQDVTITFTPAAAINYYDVLTVHSDAVGGSGGM
jgi:hypothetical protein